MRKALFIICILFSVTGILHAANNALDFDGYNDYVDCGSNANLNPGSGSFTIETWINADAMSGIRRFVWKNNGTLPPFDGYYIMTTGTDLSAGFGDATASVEVQGGPLNADTWYHVALIRDVGADKVYLYLNGVKIDEETDNTGIVDYSGNLAIGGRPGTDECFDGSLDEARFWNDVRTPTEIQEYICGDVSSESNLIAYYRMSDGSGTSLTDNSPNSNTGTLHYMDDSDWINDYLVPDGSGISDDKYQIQTINHLYWLSQNPGEWGKDFQQTANIDMTVTANWNDDHSGDAEGFSPIGTGSEVFTGSYDGQGHTISELYINTEGNDLGLFGYTLGATISNLGVIDVNLSGNQHIGGLVGNSYSSSSISNCYSTGSVHGYGAIGGLIGYNNNYSAIVDCYSSATASCVSGYCTGGLAGQNTTYATISRSYSTGSVNGAHYCGGLVGQHYDHASMDNCYATGSVSGQDYIGGLIGHCTNHVTVNYCYSTGSASGSGNVGGMVGYNDNNSVTIDNSFWDTITSGKASSSGGTGKSTAQMKALATFTDTDTDGLTTAWDFETNPYNDAANNDYWDIDNSCTINNGYPYLSWEDGEDVSLPVELTSFTAEYISAGVQLKWSTESEIENLGFIIGKRKMENGKWEEIASYQSNSALEGHGTTSERHDYQYSDNFVQPGVTYEYRLGDVDYSGKVTWYKTVEITVEAENEKIPVEFGLHKAYPNPFNPAVTLSYGLKEAGQTMLQVFNIRGQLVETLVDKHQIIGTYNVRWQPVNLSTGVYVVRLQSGNQTNLQKIVFVK